MGDAYLRSNEKENKQQKSRVAEMNRPPEVRPQNLTIGGRFSYGKI